MMKYEIQLGKLTLLGVYGSQTSQQELRRNIARKNLQPFSSGVPKLIIQNNLVDLTGRCPSVKARSKIKTTIVGIGVINYISNQDRPPGYNKHLIVKTISRKWLG